MKKLLLMALAMTSLPANAGFFDELNKVLNTTGSILDATTGSTTATQPNVGSNNSGIAGMAQATAQQRQTIYYKLATADASGNAKQALNESTPVLQGFLERVSCSDVYGMKNIGQFITLDAAKNVYSFSGAMDNTQYHPKNQCMTVTQVGNITMPALNALKLQVMFVSDASGETTSRFYLLKKQNNGQWLVDKAAGIYSVTF